MLMNDLTNSSFTFTEHVCQGGVLIVEEPSLELRLATEAPVWVQNGSSNGGIWTL